MPSAATAGSHLWDHVHPPRAADAFRLAAALVLSKDCPLLGIEQVAGVAELEGFNVIVPEAAR